ncbi:MAG: cytochrome C oxidase subunit IV family protein [Thermoanaerobaculia bacterium]
MSSAPHVVPVRVYLAVFTALMVFTAITVAAAFVNLGVFNNVVMLTIAITKATLVVLFFMHVRYSTRLIPLVVGSGVLFLVVLFALTIQDYMTRGWMGLGAAWPAIR